MRIHRKVFCEVNFNNSREVLNVNIIKKVLGHIVQMQFKSILAQIASNFSPEMFELNNIRTDGQAKIFYLNSAVIGIDKLLRGQTLIRFWATERESKTTYRFIIINPHSHKQLHFPTSFINLISYIHPSIL